MILRKLRKQFSSYFLGALRSFPAEGGSGKAKGFGARRDFTLLFYCDIFIGIHIFGTF